LALVGGAHLTITAIGISIDTSVNRHTEESIGWLWWAVPTLQGFPNFRISPIRNSEIEFLVPKKMTDAEASIVSVYERVDGS
jgi:hypothetical protein